MVGHGGTVSFRDNVCIGNWVEDRAAHAHASEALGDSRAVTGAGQSSWGPTVYGVTTAEDSEQAAADAETALEDRGLDGTVRVAAPRNTGATVDPEP